MNCYIHDDGNDHQLNWFVYNRHTFLTKDVNDLSDPVTSESQSVHSDRQPHSEEENVEVVKDLGKQHNCNQT